MPRSKRSLDLPEPDGNEPHGGTPTEKLILAELAIMREQQALMNERLASLVGHLRNKEAGAIKRKNTLYTRTDIPIVAKHQPTEEEVQAAMRRQIAWKSQQNRKVRR